MKKPRNEYFCPLAMQQCANCNRFNILYINVKDNIIYNTLYIEYNDGVEERHDHIYVLKDVMNALKQESVEELYRHIVDKYKENHNFFKEFHNELIAIDKDKFDDTTLNDNLEDVEKMFLEHLVSTQVKKDLEHYADDDLTV